MMFFLNPANHTRFFSVMLESHIDPGYINWTLTAIEEISSKDYRVCVYFEKVTALKS